MNQDEDPNHYRTLECNLRCPNFRASTIRCDRLITNGCVKRYEGCVSGTSRLYLFPHDLPPLATTTLSGRLSVFFSNATNGGYMQVYLSYFNGQPKVNTITEVVVDPAQTITFRNGAVYIQTVIVGDIAWEYNGV